jgi:glycerol kinase
VTADDALILALDQGSHASRAVLFDATGAPVAEALQTVGTQRSGADVVEQDPAELAASLAAAAADACESPAARGRPVIAAGLATQRSTVVCWDRTDGRALTAALSWQDRRNAAWLRQFDAHAPRVREITGLPLSPHYGASKLRWCLEHVPEVRRAAGLGTLAAGPLSSFLLARLLEERPVLADPANASRTLLYDRATLAWSPELLALFGLERSWLPECARTTGAFGSLSVGGQRIPLTACTGDQSAAVFAMGRPDTTTALVNVGTGAFVQRVAPPGAAVPAGLLASVLLAREDEVLRAHEGTVNGAGAALDWLQQHAALDVERALVALPADGRTGEPPLFINGVGGLGAPWWRSEFPVEFLGPGDESARLAAVLESIVFLLCVNLRALAGSAPLERIRVSGGLARSDYLCRCLAAASGLPVERHALAEATARGVAFLAAGEPSGWTPPPLERRFDPAGDAAVAARHARWREAMAARGAG